MGFNFVLDVEDSTIPDSDIDYRCEPGMVTSDGYCLICGEMDDHQTIYQAKDGTWHFTYQEATSPPYESSKQAWDAFNARSELATVLQKKFGGNTWF